VRLVQVPNSPHLLHHILRITLKALKIQGFFYAQNKSYPTLWGLQRGLQNFLEGAAY
jgi:hypothetical protein